MTQSNESTTFQTPLHDGAQSRSALTNLLRIADTVRVQLDEVLAGVGMTWARYEVLAALADGGPMTYGDMGRLLIRHRTSISTTVSALEKLDLVARYQNPFKQQQIVVRLTSRGRATVARAERLLGKRVRPDSAVLADAVSTVQQHFSDGIAGRPVYAADRERRRFRSTSC